jgi:NAD(P)-dependent dehydrogenase (short-subunit alcohol dehydrogenase family)
MGTQVLDKFWYIDILVNNAGYGEFGKVENLANLERVYENRTSLEQIEAVMMTNYFGVPRCSYNLCSQDTQVIS